MAGAVLGHGLAGFSVRAVFPLVVDRPEMLGAMASMVQKDFSW